MRTLIFLLLFLPISLDAQIITTIAGTGSSIYSGEGGAAATAGLPNPGGSEFDKFGNYYFVDAQNSQRIRKITPSGIIKTVAGNGMAGFFGDSGPATNAQLNGPQGIALDTFGNIYIADAQNNRIRKVDALTGIITTVVGTGTGPFTSDGIPATMANISNPQDVCLDKFGNMYVCDMFNYRIRKVNAAGIISTYAGNGNHGYSGEGTLADTSMIGVVVGICSDTAGSIFIASNTVCRVMKIGTTNIMSTVAGNGSCTYSMDGVPATSAQIAPLRIIVSQANNLFIADKFNNRGYIVNMASGILNNFAGDGIAGDGGDGGSATTASLHGPTGIALDACGNVYIPTAGNSVPGSGRRIRKVTFNPASISTVSISVSPNDTVCEGTPVTYTATTTGGSTMTFAWYKNGVVVPGATSATYSYTATTTEGGDSVRCVYTGVDICSFTGYPGSNTINMVVTPLMVPTVSVTAPTSAAVGSVVTVNAFVTGAGSSYSIEWYRNAVLFGTTTGPVTTFVKSAGLDLITARVSSTDATGCYDTSTSSAFAVTVADVSVKDPLSQSISRLLLHPNPAHDVLVVSAIGSINSVTIANMVGQQLDRLPMTRNGEMEVLLDISDLPAGVYVVRVNDIYFERFVKE